MKKFAMIMTSTVILFGWEINTHRAIERQAVKYSSNLKYFIDNSGIPTNYTFYDSEEFKGYHKTYIKYIEGGENNGISSSKWRQEFSKIRIPSYQKMIEAGAILEDAQWPHWIDGGRYNLYDMTHGRFINHFYDAQNGGHALTWGTYLRTDALHWALGSKIYAGSSYGRAIYLDSPNIYTYKNALNYFKLGFTSSSPAERRKYQAKMFVTLGHLMHLMNDMTSPAHTRDDSHPLGDPLEVWGRGGDDGKRPTGFRIRGNDLLAYAGISKSPDSRVRHYDRFSDFITKEAAWTATHFFSKDTVFARARPSRGDTYETVESYNYNGYGIEKRYIRSYGGDGIPSGTKLAIRIRSYILNKLGPILNADTGTVIAAETTDVFQGDYTVLKENAQVLIPKAIANARNFLDWFFRGQIEAKIDGRNITIKNISNPSLAKDSHAVTLAPGRFYIKYYHTGNFPGTREETLRDFVFTLDFKRYTQNIELIGTFSEAFPPVYTNGFSSLVALGPGESIVVPIKKDTSIIHKDIEVVYDGFIGGERGFAICFMSKPTMMSE